MKRLFSNTIVIVILLAFILACSVDTEEVIGEQDSLELKMQLSESKLRVCGTNPIFEEGYRTYSIFIEYNSETSAIDRQAIRAAHCHKIILITECSTNPNAELWVVRGNCRYPSTCKPDVVKPTDPNLRQVSFSSTCL